MVRSTADAAGQAVEILYVSGSPAEVEIVGFDPRRDHCLFALAFPGGGLLSVVMGLSIWAFRIPVNPGKYGQQARPASRRDADPVRRPWPRAPSALGSRHETARRPAAVLGPAFAGAGNEWPA